MFKNYLDIKRQFTDCLRFIVALYKSGGTDKVLDIADDNLFFDDYSLNKSEPFDDFDEYEEELEKYETIFTFITEEENQGHTCSDNQDSDNEDSLRIYSKMLYDILESIWIFNLSEETILCYGQNTPKDYSLSPEDFFERLSEKSLLYRVGILRAIAPNFQVLNALLLAIKANDIILFGELIEKFSINYDYASRLVEASICLYLNLDYHRSGLERIRPLEEGLPNAPKIKNFQTPEDFKEAYEEYEKLRKPYNKEVRALIKNIKSEKAMLISNFMHNLHKNAPSIFRSFYISYAIIDLTIHKSILGVEDFYNYPFEYIDFGITYEANKDCYKKILAIYYLSIRTNLDRNVRDLMDEWIKTQYFEPISKDYIEEILNIKGLIGDMPVDEIPAFLETVGSDLYEVVPQKTKDINKPTKRRKYLGITFEDRNKIINLAKILSDPKASCCFIDAKDVKAFVYILCGPNPNDNYVPENKIKWNFHYSTHYYMLKQLYHKKKYTTIPPGVSDDIVSNFEFYTKKNQPSAQSYITNGNKSYFKNKYANEIAFIEEAINKAFA